MQNTRRTFGLRTKEHRQRIPVQRFPVVRLSKAFGPALFHLQSFVTVLAGVPFVVIILTVRRSILGVQPLVHEPYSLFVVRRLGESFPVGGR